jgi:WD40 repeat protein
VTYLDRSRKETGHGWPFFLSDGERFVYITFSSDGESQMRLGRIGSRETTFLTEADSRVELLAPGFLVFEHDGTLLAQRFDTDAGKLTGDPFPLTEGIGTGAVGLAHFSGADNGTLVYTTGTNNARHLSWYDRAGTLTGTAGEPAYSRDPAFSSDERRLVTTIYDSQTGQDDLWVMDLRRDVESRLTFNPEDDCCGLWSTDGKLIYFNSDRNPNAISVKNAAGTGSDAVLATLDGRPIPSDVSPDGTTLLVHVRREESGWDIAAVPADGDSTRITDQIRTPFGEYSPRFSPDGKYFAYASEESGQNEVYLATFPAGDGKWQISRNGGGVPYWREDGKELYFASPDNRAMAVDISLGDEVEIGLPHELFRAPVASVGARNLWAVPGDGQRFLIVTSEATRYVPPITVVLNWAAELKER